MWVGLQYFLPKLVTGLAIRSRDKLKIYLRCAQLGIFGDEFFDISWQVDADIFLMAIEVADAHKAV
jgi:hypothetical protein